MQHNIVADPSIFFRAPQKFDRNSDPAFLRYCLGGTLYMPSTRAVMDKIVAGELSDVLSMVMCFEDAIRAEDLPTGEANVITQLGFLAQQVQSGALDNSEVPLIFLRVRSVAQFQSFARKLTPELADILSGFVFPKFYSDNAHEYLDLLAELNTKFATRLYGMPILEGRDIAFAETRRDELFALMKKVRSYHQYILNIRVGGTDFSSFFGVRRGIGSSVYDILPVRDALADILNFFGRAEEDYVISAPVWEYFLAYKRDDLKKVMQVDLHRSLRTNAPILNDAIDGLLREIVLDKANGFTGKTVIHPSHLRYVNAMQAVTREEYEDACQILDTSGGVIKSAKSNKMNEINPHRSWARRISHLADAYGVVEDERQIVALFR
ncbi:ATP/GTP-binding protein [Pseudorhodobacter sp. E13]|uniref:HpcH/HpaI aldolase/citrate lyase family protein n=1 Tax=Pseudorhodobacter sp. E13 TaxID=2487931 RepID=UPI000F8DB14D|nr:HpcH/HpaI aldolase/citrate lyase family protein [Pseudorhodobacter sp. E13]RUS64827.1 ATP/GTP-binding protein [Pseudorhodobacter sp. E13]